VGGGGFKLAAEAAARLKSLQRCAKAEADGAIPVPSSPRRKPGSSRPVPLYRPRSGYRASADSIRLAPRATARLRVDPE